MTISKHSCIAVICSTKFACSFSVPLVAEPGNSNGILVYDLRDRLFVRTEDLPEGMARLPVKSVKINKCPALAPQKTLDAAAAERIAIDQDACARHWEQLNTNKDFMQRVAQAYSSREFSPSGDADLALYDGFLVMQIVPS